MVEVEGHVVDVDVDEEYDEEEVEDRAPITGLADMEDAPTETEVSVLL